MFRLFHHHTITIQILAESIASSCFMNYYMDSASFLTSANISSYFSLHPIISSQSSNNSVQESPSLLLSRAYQSSSLFISPPTLDNNRPVVPISKLPPEAVSPIPSASVVDAVSCPMDICPASAVPNPLVSTSAMVTLHVPNVAVIPPSEDPSIPVASSLEEPENPTVSTIPVASVQEVTPIPQVRSPMLSSLIHPEVPVLNTSPDELLDKTALPISDGAVAPVHETAIMSVSENPISEVVAPVSDNSIPEAVVAPVHETAIMSVSENPISEVVAPVSENSIPEAVVASIPEAVVASVAPVAIPTSTPIPATFSSASTNTYPFASVPLLVPTTVPESVSAIVPSVIPDSIPSSAPNAVVESVPESIPTAIPATVPTTVATTVPATVPTAIPESIPTAIPESIPTAIPESIPTAIPESIPTAIPATVPATLPGSVPTSVPLGLLASPPLLSVSATPSSHSIPYFDTKTGSVVVETSIPITPLNTIHPKPTSPGEKRGIEYYLTFPPDVTIDVGSPISNIPTENSNSISRADFVSLLTATNPTNTTAVTSFARDVYDALDIWREEKVETKTILGILCLFESYPLPKRCQVIFNNGNN